MKNKTNGKENDNWQYRVFISCCENRKWYCGNVSDKDDFVADFNGVTSPYVFILLPLHFQSCRKVELPLYPCSPHLLQTCYFVGESP